MIPILSNSKETICLSAILCLFFPFILSSAAGSDWPDCNFHCRAKDVTITDLWLGDAQGNLLSACAQNISADAYIWARFKNNANSPRYAVIILCDIYVDGALQESHYDDGGLCVLDTIPAGSENSLSLYGFSFSCGQEVRIEKLVISWETANGIDCSNANRRCSNRNTKCYRETGSIDLTPPSCQIEGPNIPCESIIASYLPQITRGPELEPQLIWRIDGMDAEDESVEEGLQVDWRDYGSGYHILQLIIDWNDDHGRLVQSCTDSLRILVVEVPSNVIELTSGTETLND
jgi:hypothetical protein